MVTVTDGQRVAKFVDFVNGRTHAVRRQRPRHARRRHHRRQRLRLERRAERASRRTRTLVGAEGARRQRPAARSATSSRRSTGSSRTATTYNIRVVNLSVGARDSRVVLDRPADARGQARRSTRASSSSPRPATSARTPHGKPQYGGITAPGNAPWVLTVGASSTEGTLTRTDDTMAGFSSRGPDGHRLRGEAGPRRAGHRHRVAGGAGQHVRTLTKPPCLLAGTLALGVQAVSEPERHQHGGAGRHRHGRADAAGEPER